MPKRKSPEKFEAEVFEIHGTDIILVSEYVKASEKVVVKHTICGTTWTTLPQNLIKGHSCSKCAGNKKHTYQEVKEVVENTTNSEYKLLGDYTNVKVHLKVKHEKCGSIYNVKLHDFQSGKRCGKCFGNSKKTQGEFEYEVKILTDGEYEVLGKYISARAKVMIRHVSCGFEFNVRATSFLGSGSRCPKCAKSKGEQKIQKFLESTNLIYETEYRFNDCKDKRRLPFDFAILNILGDVLVLIEFDGRQHFESFDHFGGEDALLDRIRKDEIKNKYCKENGIELIRISHKDFKNVNVILTKKLIEMGIL